MERFVTFKLMEREKSLYITINVAEMLYFYTSKTDTGQLFVLMVLKNGKEFNLDAKYDDVYGAVNHKWDLRIKKYYNI